MAIFRLDKLVRDNFVEIYEELGEKPKYRFLEPAEYRRKLIDKVVEEAHELTNADKVTAEEIADIKQVLDDLMAVYGIENDEVEGIKQSKYDKKGGFQKGLYIETLEVDESDPWAAYYRKEPDRFPEV